MANELDTVDLTNTDQRCAVILVVDTSGSMAGDRIDELNKGLVAFKNQLLDDPIARTRVELAILAFNSGVEVVRDFGPVTEFEPPVLVAQNQTFMGTAICEALDCIDARKTIYKKSGLPYNRPWLFLITDGQPEGEAPDMIQQAKRRLKDAQDQKHVVVWAVGVGDGVDFALLQDVCGKTPARLKGAKFGDMFSWLSASMAKLSASTPGDVVNLTPPDWATFQA